MRKYISLLFILFVAFGCEKKQEQRLLGEWEMIPLSEAYVGKEIVWTFYDSGVLTQTISGDSITVDTAGYSFSVNFVGKEELIITDLDVLIYDGKYSISELSESILIINRIAKSNGITGGAFMWREFQAK